MKTILVTGGAGFIGSHTVVELAQAGYKPVIIDNFSNSERSVSKAINKLLGQAIAVYDQDYQDLAKLRKVVEKEHPIGIIHFAAFKAVGESVKRPLKYYHNNIGGLIDFLEFIEAKSSVKHFVFSSSCTVYGEPKQLPVTESTPWQPAASPYAATKQMGETIISDATTISKQFNAIALRYFNPIGAHPSGLIGELPIGIPENLVPYITQSAAGMRPALTVFGNNYPTPDGSCIRDYIHVVDLAQAHVKALNYLVEKPNQLFEAVNIGTARGSSVLEVINTFEKVTGQKLDYKIGPRRSGDVIATYAAVEKARDILGWSAKKSLSEALSDAWRWQLTLQ